MSERCPGCFPKFVDPQTGDPSTIPFAKKAEELFAAFTDDEAAALHRVNCLGSTDKADMIRVQKLLGGVEAAFDAWRKSS